MEQRFETFTTQIAKASRLIRKIKSEEVKEFNLKSPHISCIYYLFKSKDGLTAKELCDICDEDKSSISRSIEFLEKEGLISCDSKNEKRYKSPLYLTENGIKIGKDIAKKIDEIVNKASEGLSEEKRVMFYESLKLINDNLQKICKKYGDNYES